MHRIAVADLASEQLASELVTNGLLNQATQRTSTIIWVVAALGEPVLGREINIEFQTALLQTRRQALQLDIDDALKQFRRQWFKDNHVLKTINKLRLECLLHSCHDLLTVATGAEIRGQNDNRIAEIDGAALAIGPAAIGTPLQQDTEDIRVGFLNFIEKHQRVRTTTHCLGELTASLVADISRRRTDKTCNRVLLAVLRHVDANHRGFIIEQELR